FVENAADVGDRMQVEVAPDVAILEARAKQESSGVNRSAGDNDVLALHDNTVPGSGAGLDTGGGAVARADALGAGMYQKFGAVGLSIGQPGFGRRLFGADRAAVTAKAAEGTLFAADDVAGHGVHMPAEAAQAAFHHLFAMRDAIVILVDGEAGADG